jgi:dTDP-4-amino-4,6-dideoxy-D-galactose acyltransferase
MKQYQISNWDSDVFGFGVAKILPARLNHLELKEVLEELKLKKVKLVYWASDPQAPFAQQAAEQCNGFLADHKVTYYAALSHPSNLTFPGVAVEEYAADLPDRDLEFLALQSGIYSRFKVDPRIPKEIFEKIYKLWIANSAKRIIAKNIFVVKKDRRIVGMATLGEKNNRGDIGLLAVHPDYRGLKIGSALMNAARNWFVQQGYTQSQVVTQHANKPACALYEKCGYVIENIEFFYHFWL